MVGMKSHQNAIFRGVAACIGSRDMAEALADHMARLREEGHWTEQELRSIEATIWHRVNPVDIRPVGRWQASDN
jgi:hypothetical protein